MDITILCSHSGPSQRDKKAIDDIIAALKKAHLGKKIQIIHGGGGNGSMRYLDERLAEENFKVKGICCPEYSPKHYKPKNLIMTKNIFERYYWLSQSNIILNLPEGGEGTEAEIKAALTLIKILGFKYKKGRKIDTTEYKYLLLTGHLKRRIKGYIKFYISEGNTSFNQQIVFDCIKELKSNNIGQQLVYHIREYRKKYSSGS